MRITTQGDYGLLCVLSIASQQGNGPVSIQSIVNKEQLPVDYIEQLLLKLRKAGIVKSIRGRIGGYILSRPARRISVKDIIEAVEGNVFEVICARPRKDDSRCLKRNNCLVKPVWQNLKKMIENYVKNITINDLLKQAQKFQYRNGGGNYDGRLKTKSRKRIK